MDGTLEKIFSNAPNLSVSVSPKNPGVSVLAVGLKPYHILKMWGYAFLFLVSLIVASEL